MINPFTLQFGKEPRNFLSREQYINRIEEEFNDEYPPTQIYIFTGTRGCGKTVLLSALSKKFEKSDNWIVIRLNSARNVLESFVAKLENHEKIRHWSLDGKLNISIGGVGVELSSNKREIDIEDRIERILKELDKNNKKLLVTIDDVAKTPEIAAFISAYQLFLQQDLPFFLLMTGLFENVSEIQNQKNLTFLHRAPKIYLEPLNFNSMKKSYMSILDIDDKTASKLAEITMGYSYAYQIVGYYYFETDGDMQRTIDSLDIELQTQVYEKIWSELSEKDRLVIIQLSNISERVKVGELRSVLNMSSNEFTVYRDRLKRKGIINTSEYGYISVALPRLTNFALQMSDL